MKAAEVARCPKCGAYCFPDEHSPEACGQIARLHAQNALLINARSGETGDAPRAGKRK